MDQPRIIELEHWMDSPPGQYIISWQQQQIDELIGNVFGYHAVQAGLPSINFLRANRIRHKIITTSGWFNVNGNSKPYSLVSDPECLPFESGTIDLIILPHVLECSSNPHQVLREVERVLRPEGTLVISGFNPWSLWGMRERMPGLIPRLPIPAHDLVSLVRLRDWLRLLSLEPGRGHFGGYAPLCRSSKWLYRWSFVEGAGHRWWPFFGACYVISAVKRVSGMRLVGPVWKSSRARARRGRVATVHTLGSRRKADLHD